MTDNKKEKNDVIGLHTLKVIAKAERFNRWMYDQIKDNLKGEILEIGSGIGNISKLVIESNHFITLSDYNKEYCHILKENFSTNKNVREVIQIDLLDPGFEKKYASFKEKFDSIFLLNVIEHIEDDKLSIKNCRYLLKPGGHLILLAPAYSWLYGTFDEQLGHYRRYTVKTLTELLEEKKFKILSGSYFNVTGIAGWLLFGKIFRRSKIGKGEMAAFNSIVPFAKLTDKLLARKAGLSIIITGIKQ
jgi:2-polyprenyl-3-methyl-5-hydroxy-6-metoxy-1,4-benzoquinol methylase